MKRSILETLRSFMAEAVAYAALMAGYAFLVLHFLSGWLLQLFRQERVAYAAVSLGLIVAQGFLLERITALILLLLRKPKARP